MPVLSALPAASTRHRACLLPGLVTGLLLCVVVSARAGDVTVAVAANFAAPMAKLVPLFEQDTGHKVVAALGSTGKLHAQIRNGAPFEVLMSADDETPQKLEAEGLGVKGSRHTYAVGRLALWSADAGRIDARGEVLRLNTTDRLAVADPKLAPYGQAALETLTRMGLLQAWRHRLVTGENIAQTFQFTSSGNAPLGFVALSQIQQDGRLTLGSVWIVPATWHAPLKHDAILLKPGRNAAAQAWMAWLRQDRARAVIRSFGYETP